MRRNDRESYKGTRGGPSTWAALGAIWFSYLVGSGILVALIFIQHFGKENPRGTGSVVVSALLGLVATFVALVQAFRYGEFARAHKLNG